MPTPRTLRSWRRLFKPQRIGHTRKGVRYALGNSLQGIRMMAAIGKKWADRDIRKTKDGYFVVIHWLKDFKVPASFPHTVEQMTLKQVLALRSKSGDWRVHTLQDDLVALHRVHMGAYLEPKAHNMTQADWNLIRQWGRHFGVPLRGYALIANRSQVPLMNKAGIPSHVLNK